jgi:hypothetical protein
MKHPLLRAWIKDAVWAIVFAIVLWLVVDRSVQQTRTFQLDIEIQAPRDYVVEYIGSGTRPPQAQISVTAPSAVIDDIKSPVFATITPEVDDEQLGQVLELRLDKFDLPAELKSAERAFEPATVRYRFSKKASEYLEVDLDPGPIPEGWELTSFDITPEEVLATGPQREITQRPRPKLVVARRINLSALLAREGADGSKAVSLTSILSQVQGPEGSGVVPRDPDERVSVTIHLRPKQIERELQFRPTFAIDAPWLNEARYRVDDKELRGSLILLPANASADQIRVTLSGPPKVMADEKLVREKVRVFALFERDAIIGPDLETNRPRLIPVEVYSTDPRLVILDFDKEFEVEVGEPAPARPSED